MTDFKETELSAKLREFCELNNCNVEFNMDLQCYEIRLNSKTLMSQMYERDDKNHLTYDP